MSGEQIDRLNDPSRKLLKVAHDEATRLGSRVVLPEHVLLALLRCGGDVVSRALAARGLTLDRVRGTIRNALGEDRP